MKTKNLIKTALFYCTLFVANIVLAQSTISGKITDEDQLPLPGANIIIEGTNVGASSDFEGNFTLNSSVELPFKIIISSVGFGSQTIEVTESDQEINILLEAGHNLDEIIISASRRPEKIQEAPSSVSVISSRVIENSANVVDPSRVAAIPTCQHLLDDLSLQVILRPAEITRNNGKLL